MNICNQIHVGYALSLWIIKHALSEVIVNFFLKDFSLSHWLVNEHIVVGQKLPDYAVDLLTEQLGIAQYLHKNQCKTRNMHHVSNVWNTSGNINGNSSGVLTFGF